MCIAQMIDYKGNETDRKTEVSTPHLFRSYPNQIFTHFFILPSQSSQLPEYGGGVRLSSEQVH